MDFSFLVIDIVLLRRVAFRCLTMVYALLYILIKHIYMYIVEKHCCSDFIDPWKAARLVDVE